jgi:hypothetical protein
VDSCPKAEPREQKSLTLYTLASRYRSKNQSSTHIWLHVTSLAISVSQCCVTFFMFQFFKFYLSALPSLPPASLPEHSLSVSFLALLPATVILFQTWTLRTQCFSQENIILVECLPSMYKTLGLISSTRQRERKRKEGR